VCTFGDELLEPRAGLRNGVRSGDPDDIETELLGFGA
jgi:hypothetical protein